jgi:hypothetical protein
MTAPLPVDLSPWAQRVEEAYIAAVLGRPAPAAMARADLDDAGLEAIAAACACAVAARFLAVGKPRSLGIISDDPRRARILLAGHRVWHDPSDLRWAGAISMDAALLADGGRAVAVAEALTSDIVCVDVDLQISNGQARRGSHLNLLVSDATPELLHRAMCFAESSAAGIHATIGDLAAGLRDGRQLDEITLLLAGGANGLVLARRAVGL